MRLRRRDRRGIHRVERFQLPDACAGLARQAGQETQDHSRCGSADEQMIFKHAQQIAMASRSLQILAATSWIVMSVCAVVFLYFAIAIPNVISENIIRDRDKNVQEIRSSTDLHEVQQIATWRTQEEAYISDSARMLLIIAVVTLLLCMICSGVNLFQIRRLKKQLQR